MVSLSNSKRKMAEPPVYEDGLFELSIDLRIRWTIP
jgi:hypothetical protein